jgi:gluconate 5-dehydrogenase
MFNLSNDIAVISGASSGLGRQMARAFAAQGANLVILARRVERLEELKAEIEEKYSVKVLAVKCDVTDTNSINAAAEAAEKEFGKVDILVNCAGASKDKGVLDMTDDEWDFTINTDLSSVFKMTRAFANIMKKNHYGRIINIASMYGLVGNKVAPASPYHAAKGGVVNLTRALASEWGKYNITVNAICPGYFYSPLTKETLDSDFFQQNAKTMIPLERYGNDGELDTAICFLASPASTYVTGVNLPVDGGYTAM